MLACGVLAMIGTLHAGQSWQYRGHVLGGAVADVLAVTGARADDVVTEHERPALVQTLTWRPPYTRTERADADPVDRIRFSFVDGTLYEIAVAYEQARIASLTTSDLVAGVTTLYGAPHARRARPDTREVIGPEGSVALARWGDEEITVTLVRGPYEDTTLLLRSTRWLERATRAIAASRAQDLQEAPARRAAALAADTARREAERVRNRVAFTP